jgi:Tol biopolymer transport system component
MSRFTAALLLAPTLAFSQTEAEFIQNARQLTFEGKRSGEGYFSADGSKMVFQSERQADNPFYQIYLMDLETGDQEQVSPGAGKTTCAWIHPSGQSVMFASTHLDGSSKDKQKAEFEERISGRVRKYSWDYDENYDLFEFTLADKSLKRLTDARGYDAEGAYSPDGRKIVFASNRAAYADTLSAADTERLKLDKQYFMDLYLCDADGSDVQRLTDVPGYDGGPFFSSDGKQICWRRFDEKGMIAEIMVMDADGKNPRQVTKLGAMSWAPFFHPSGDYIIFTTNLHGFDNFELYAVAAKKETKPIRITSTEGFDGLPVFSPNGKQLSWTAGRTASKASQIFLADWNHEAVRKALQL